MYHFNHIPFYPKTSNLTNTFLKKKNLFFCILLLSNTEVRGFRIIFQKPVNGQLTNSNASTIKNNTHLLFNYKYNVFKKLIGLNLTKPLFLAEYINLFWQQQWVYEWVSSYKFLKKLPIYLQKTNFIDIPNITLFNIYHYYNSPFKLKKKNSQKRKKTIPKNKFTTGLVFGFNIIFSKQLQIISKYN